MKVKKRESFRLSADDQTIITLASELSDIPKSEIIRSGALKEAKKILKDIEKGK